MQTQKSEWSVAEVQVSYKPTHDRTVTITKSEDAHRVLREMWDDEMISIQEQFCVLFLNNGNEVIGFRCLHTGTSSACVVDVRLLMGLCCKLLAPGIIIAHNHPSGSLKISKDDEMVTEQVKSAAQLLGVTLLDHIIITSKSYVSLADNGIIL